jgi:hypothetical protein
MNKNGQKILMYAEVGRKLSEVQDTYVTNIVDELLKIHPDINEINPEDSAENWAYDIINASDNHEVIETLNRLNDILQEKRSTNKELSKEERLNIKNKELMEYIGKLERELSIVKSVHESNY